MKSEKFFTFKNDNIFSFCSLNQNFALSLQTNYINLVNNVAGVSASDDDLRYFGGSAGTLPHTKAVTLSIVFLVSKKSTLTITLTMTIMGARDFRKYSVWQEAVDYASFVYEVTGKMPWFEKKGLCDQLQRAVVSISSNIAEGAARSSDTDFCHFLDFALGSAFEVETQLTIAKNVGYFKNLDTDLDVNFQELMDKIHSIERQLNGLINSIRNQR